MTSQKNHINTLIILKLILLSFLFAMPSNPTLNWHKTDTSKFAQFEVHADVVLLKSHSEAKHFKRIPFLDDALSRDLPHFNIVNDTLADSFFDFHILHSSYNLQSSLARAPPV